MKDLVSLIILNWNGEGYLTQCLESVISQDYDPLEVIVVDNGSTDSSVDLVKTRYGQVKLIETKVNLGFAAGNNVGIREAKGDFVVILNNDAELAPSCISEMKRTIDRDPAYGACASRIYLKYEKDLIDAAGIVICPDGLSIGRGRLESGDAYGEEKEVFFGSGCCIMCKKAMLEDVRMGECYFDEDFFMYADDTDLGWRARLRGWKCIYAPGARVYHLHSASRGSYSASKAFLVERNRIWIQIKCFPLPLLLFGLFYTLARYSVQSYGAFFGKGAAGAFVDQHSRSALILVLLKAILSALSDLPRLIRKRRQIGKGRKISTREIFRALKHYGIGPRRVALTS
jgi:GT2 family glycosyltransferase